MLCFVNKNSRRKAEKRGQSDFLGLPLGLKASFLLTFLDISITKLSLPITPPFWVQKRIKLNSLSGKRCQEPFLQTVIKKFKRFLTPFTFEKRFLGIKELSEYLGVKESTLYSWTHMRKIPYVKIGRLVKFDLREIDKWIDKKRVKAFRWKGLEL